MIRAVFFDWGDTLSSSDVFLPDATRSAVALIRPELSPVEQASLGMAAWNSIVWDGLDGLHPQLAGELAVSGFCKGLARSLSLDVREDGLAQMRHAFLKGLAESQSLFPDAVSTLSNLKAQGFQLGIISNNMVEFVTPCLKFLGIGGLFDLVVISGEVGLGKPSPAIFKHAISMLRMDAAETAMVGDSPEADIIGAAGAGMKSVWIRRAGKAARPDVRPDYEIRQLGELSLIAAKWKDA